MAVIGVSGLELVARPAAGLAAAPGESHDGLALRDRQAPTGGPLLRVLADPPADPPAAPVGAASGLTLRQGCAWGQPGRQPYRGTTEQALSAAGLPHEVVRQIAAMRLAGGRSGRLAISRSAIRQVDGPRAFNPRSMAMSFGLTLCLNTRVNFAPGHVEPADLYEARDASGRMYSVMVPDVCGNVTVLGARAEGGVVAGVAATLTQRSEALAAVVEALVADGDPGDPGAAARLAMLPGHALVPGAALVPDAALVPGAALAAGAALVPDAALVPGAALAPDAPIRGGGLPVARAVSGAGAVVPAVYSGAAGAAHGLPQRMGDVLWQGLRSSTEPRLVAAAALKRLADGLAWSGETVLVLAGPPASRGQAQTGQRDRGVAIPYNVPEPGSLAWVLAALVAAWCGTRRR